MQLPIIVLQAILSVNEKYKDHLQEIKGDDEWPYHVVARLFKEPNFFFKVQLSKESKSSSGVPVIKLTKQPNSRNDPREISYNISIEKSIDTFKAHYSGWVDMLIETENMLSKSGLLGQGFEDDILDRRREKTNQYIKEIAIFNFKGISELLFSELQKVNILLGKNASGKTSILQALALALIPDNNEEDLELKNYIRIDAQASQVQIIRKNEIRTLVVRSNEKTSASAPLRFDLKLDYSNEPFFFAYGPNIFSQKKNKKSTDTNSAINAVVAKRIVEGSKYWYAIESLFDESSTSFSDPLDLLDELTKYPSDEKYQSQENEIKELTAFLIEKINCFIIGNLELRQVKSFHYFIDKQGQQLKTNQLSEGYRNNVLLLTDIITRIMALRHELKGFLGKPNLSIAEVFEQAKGVIAIDEFDRHLHPSWQRKFVQQLTNLLPKAQFFLTTHNPLAVLDRKKGEVQKLVIQEDGSLVAETGKQATEDMNVSLVLLEYFEMDSVVSEHLQTQIDSYYRQRLSGVPDEQLQDLKNKLNASHTGITIPDERYLAYLRILKKHGINPFEKPKTAVKLSEEEIEELKNLL